MSLSFSLVNTSPSLGGSEKPWLHRLTVLLQVVGAALHHVRHVLGLLVDGRRPEDGARRGVPVYQDLDLAGLRQLAVELVQSARVLKRRVRNKNKKKKMNQCVFVTFSTETREDSKNPKVVPAD